MVSAGPEDFVLVWPRAKGAILLVLAAVGLTLVLLTDPTFVVNRSFENFSPGRWAFLAGSLVLLAMGGKMVALPRLIIRCTSEGVYIPRCGQIIPWRQVESVSSTRMKLAATSQSSEAVAESRHGEAVRLDFSREVRIPTRPKHAEFRAESERTYVFSAGLSRLSAAEIVATLETLRTSV